MSSRGVGSRAVHVDVNLNDVAPSELSPLRPPTGRESSRDALRSRLGVSESDIVVVLTGHADDPRAGSIFVVVIGLVEATGRSIVGVIPSSSAGAGRAIRLQHPPGVPTRITITSLPECLAIAASDIVIVAPRSWRRDARMTDANRSEVCALVLASACASGRPVIVPDSARNRALAERRCARVEFALNGAATESARALIGALTSRRPATIDTPIDHATTPENFASRVIERLDAS
jgi:hypothetical protein